MSQDGTLFFPPQKLPFKKKDKKWAEQCVEAGEDIAIFRHDGIRQSYQNKVTNYNLANDILDTKDLETVCNPMGIKGASFPAKMQNYPIVNPKIDLLVGEERKRRFDWKVRVKNQDAISKKEKQMQQELLQYVQQLISSEAMDEQQAEKELMEMQKYHLYSFQDLRERTATHILKYLYAYLNLKEEFAKGFEDALIVGEEIYCADIMGGEPILRKVNPLNLHTVRNGESPWIEDSDIIVEDGYHSPGQVIDMYHDVLTPEDVKTIDQGITSSESDGMISIGEREHSWVLDGILDVEGEATGNRFYGEFWDTEGNIRVTRVLWRSYKKIGKLKYFDEQDGTPQETIVSEAYKLNKESGEEIKWFWINEWWEGTRIGKSIYVKMQPRPLQFRNIDNPSKCSPGYTGIAYNINTSRAKSLMDRMKPYQYLYNVFMYRTEMAFAKAKGRIATLDLAQVPDHWDMDKWMYYAEVNGWAVRDSFKEAKKGAAQGKLAGQMNVQSDTINLELGNYIQQHIMMLSFLEAQVGDIAGVSKQRQGQIENRELVGNVERSVTQSSHITEKWFAIHGNVKQKSLALLLDTARLAWREGNRKKIQYVLDDMSTTMVDMDPVEFSSAEYDIFISNSSADAELLQTIKGLAQSGMQNGLIDFTGIMDIYTTESISDMRRKIEQKEVEKKQAEQQAQEQSQKMQEQQLQAQKEQQQAAQEFEMAKIDKEYGYKLQIEEMKAEVRMNEKLVDNDHDGIPDILEAAKAEADAANRDKEIQAKERLGEAKLKVEEAKLSSQKEIDKAKIKQLDKELSQKKITEQKERENKLKIAQINAKAKKTPLVTK
tara:strand:- start:956 stop:3442 length:2487 start_codon:yes stop_codon:yes gene_type:complete